MDLVGFCSRWFQVPAGGLSKSTSGSIRLEGLDWRSRSATSSEGKLLPLGWLVRVKIGGLHVALDPVLTDEIEMTGELWVGAVFAGDGSISEGPVLHQDQGHARGWVGAQGADDPRRRSAERPGEDTTCRFKHGGRLHFATSTRAKVVAPFSAVVTMDLPDVVQPSTYDIDVVATFTHVVSTSFSAEPGLSREALESRIDEEFPHLGFQRGMLTDLTWELDDFSERPGLKYRIQPQGDDPEEPRPRVVRDP